MLEHSASLQVVGANFEPHQHAVLGRDDEDVAPRHAMPLPDFDTFEMTGADVDGRIKMVEEDGISETEGIVVTFVTFVTVGVVAVPGKEAVKIDEKEVVAAGKSDWK